MSSVRVAYNEKEAPLEVLLRTIDRPGDFCTQDRMLVPMPRVEVEGARSLSFPITEEQAHALVAVAEPAPYGRGEQTLVDRSVRACRQIDAARVRITGRAWRDTLAQVVARAATGLGCPPEQTSACLYKLLVYEKGGFFAPHRDTEKVDGMVATLVLSLPVAGAGGELVIRHREHEKVVDLRTDEASELAFAAFYADCVHEIRPVTDGYRIVLVYHLVVRGAAAAVLKAAPYYRSQEEQIAARFRNWEATSTAGDKLVWLLEHEYSEAGLSFDVLKNADAVLGRVLARAAEQAKQVLYAAILGISEWGTLPELAESLDWDEPSDDWESMELVHSTRSLVGLVAPDGSRPDYGELPLLPGELLPAGALDGVAPDQEDTRFTGNAGVEMSRSYRRAALVLWPRERTVGTLARGDIEGALAWFADDLARSQRDIRSQPRLSGLAAQLIAAWPEPDPARFHSRHRSDWSQPAYGEALRLLHRLGDEATIRRFLCEVATQHYSGAENVELLRTATEVAPAVLHTWLPQFTAANFSHAPGDVLDLLWRLHRQEDSGPDLIRRLALVEAVRAVCLLLPVVVEGAATAQPAAARFRPARRWNSGRPLTARAIRSLFALIWHCAQPAAAAEAAALLVQRPEAAPPDRALPLALAELAKLDGMAGDATESAGFAALWRHAAAFLLARSPAPPEEPRDWVIESVVGCDCPNCDRLRAFCADAVATTLRFSMRQDMRLHIESVITFGRLDIDCRTEREGRSDILICTKTRASYERRCAQYAQDVTHMRLLVAAAPGSGAAVADDLGQLHAALARAGRAVSPSESRS